MLAVVARAGEDCNDDGIPDDQLGLGRLFSDTFPWTTPDSTKWVVVDGATIDDVGLNEPTEPYSLRLNGYPYGTPPSGDPPGGDSIESVPIDLSIATDVVLTYSWQRTGGGESPDGNDDLFVEFADETGAWIILGQHLGDGPDMTQFLQRQVVLPPEAYHPSFVLRFRGIGTLVPTGLVDDWFIDDVFITDGVPDCNNNGIPDDCDIAEGTSLDCNANGIPDACDIGEGISADCNANYVPDECDVAEGTSEDVNGDYIPDECQDCNANGVLDPNDIADGTSADCNANGIPDECDLDSGSSVDCNGNGVPDTCDIAPMTYQVDDGAAEGSVNTGDDGRLIWLNQFTVEPRREYIVAVDLAYYRVAEGSPTTVAVWIDPDNDGDPTNATLLLTAGPFPADDPGINRFVRVALPRTHLGEPGDVFFVGAYHFHQQSEYPAALDMSAPSLGRSWYVRGDNLEQLGANPGPPVLIDDVGYPGDWLLRCLTTHKDCNDNALLDECDIAAGASYDNDLSEVPDECELGTAVDLELLFDATCYGAGDTVTVEIWMNAAEATIVGGQFFLDYDASRLDLFDVTPASPPSPFLHEVYECSTKAGGESPQCDQVAGTIDYAVGVLPEGPGVAGSAQMAIMTFTALEPVCSGVDLLAWRSDGVIRLADEYDTPHYPLLTHLGSAVGDYTPPSLTVPADGVANLVPGEGCSVTLDPGLATATDDCTDALDIGISWERSDGQMELIDPYDVVDSPITISWWAEDECGNWSSDVTTITVVLLGDLDHDNDVDLADLATLLGSYGMTSGAVYEDGDLDGDGDVDLADLAELLSYYGATCP